MHLKLASTYRNIEVHACSCPLSFVVNVLDLKITHKTSTRIDYLYSMYKLKFCMSCNVYNNPEKF